MELEKSNNTEKGEASSEEIGNASDAESGAESDEVLFPYKVRDGEPMKRDVCAFVFVSNAHSTGPSGVLGGFGFCAQKPNSINHAKRYNRSVRFVGRRAYRGATFAALEGVEKGRSGIYLPCYMPKSARRGCCHQIAFRRGQNILRDHLLDYYYCTQYCRTTPIYHLEKAYILAGPRYP